MISHSYIIATLADRPRLRSEVTAQVDTFSKSDGTRTTLGFGRYNHETWTERVRKGWESQLDRLAELIAAQGGSRA